MTPFLQQVAAHYLAGPAFSRQAFVFPNRRSMVFFKKYLTDLLRTRGAKAPLVVPPLYTINDFFCRGARAQVSDRLRLLLVLYDCYQKLYPQAEPLDDFLFWGDVLLADFDDVDKYLVDARKLMQNVGEFKEIQDKFDYLTEGQQEAIDQFLSHFRDKGGRLSLDPNGTDVKANFLRLWNLLYPLYTAFNQALSQQGLAYEGMIYRRLATSLKEGVSVKDLLTETFPGVEHFVFVGLNALNECEGTVLARMRDARLASFVWDYVSPEIQDPANKSSFFMRRNLERFPQAFPIDPQGLSKPEVHVVSVPSAIGQTKLAPYILEQTGGGDPVKTAFVLADESLLLPLLSAIPETQDQINVTMGYPMSGSAVFTLLTALGQMQLKLRPVGDKWLFYHRELREVLSSGLLKPLFTEEEKACIARVKADAKYYVPQEDLQGGPLMRLLFQPVVLEPRKASAPQNHAVEAYLSALLSFIGQALAQQGNLLELDFAKRCHTQLNILQETDLEVRPDTHLRLLERLLQGISVPFRGEPLQGLQVMGPLETRALDFENLIVLSANEAVFPRRSVSASFIPPELRRGFGLPTYEYQDAVWAYYFYRMIQRPRQVWLVCDSRTEGLKSGEESRYIKQLEYHFGWKLHRYTASAALHTVPDEGAIPKTQEHLDKIRSRRLSPTTLQSYLYCPAQFYYKMVEGLQAPDEVAESLDTGMLGTIYHKVMEELYKGTKFLSREQLAALRKDTARIRGLIRSLVLEKMHSIEVSGRNLVLENILEGYVQETLAHDLKLLEDNGAAGFELLGLEKEVHARINGFDFVGKVDRIDSYKPGQVRILDYKTGHVADNEILITDQNAPEVAALLFGPDNKNRPKIALQLFLYDYYLKDAFPAGTTLVNAIYSTARLYSTPLPDVPVSAEFSRLAMEKLEETLRELTNLSVPFRRTSETKTCEWCDFKAICGR